MKHTTTRGAKPRGAAVRAEKIVYLPVDAIEIEENFNPRQFDTDEMRERIRDFKESIRAMGVKTPMVVRKDAGHVILVGGETRLRACRELIAEGVDIKAVPVRFEKATNEAHRILLALTDNSGKPLTQLESGLGYTRLVGYGWTPEQIAKSIGQPKRYVTEALSLADAPVEVKKLVASKVVTPARALAEVREHGSRSVAVLKAKIREARDTTGQAVLRREKKDSPLTARLKQAQALLVRAAGDLVKYDLNTELVDEIDEFLATSNAQ